MLSTTMATISTTMTPTSTTMCLSLIFIQATIMFLTLTSTSTSTTQADSFYHCHLQPHTKTIITTRTATNYQAAVTRRSTLGRLTLWRRRGASRSWCYGSCR